MCIRDRSYVSIRTNSQGSFYDKKEEKMKKGPFKMHSLKDTLNNILEGSGSIMDLYGVDDNRKKFFENLRNFPRVQEAAIKLANDIFIQIFEALQSGEKIIYKKGEKKYQLMLIEVKGDFDPKTI
jgi:hypothetical protein